MKLLVLLIAFVSFTQSLFASIPILQDVIHNYVKFSGGFYQWNKIKSVSSSGYVTYLYENQNKIAYFETVRKSPNYYYSMTRFEDQSLKIYEGYNGKEFWTKAIDTNSLEESLLQIEEHREKEVYENISLMPFLYYLYKENCMKNIINNKENKTFEINAESKHFSDRQYNFILSEDTYELISKEILNNGNRIYIEYYEYVWVDNCKFPSKIKKYWANDEITETIITNIRINRGIINTLFNLGHSFGKF